MPGFLLRVVRVPESRGAWRRPRCEGGFWEAPVGSGQHAGVDGGASFVFFAQRERGNPALMLPPAGHLRRPDVRRAVLGRRGAPHPERGGRHVSSCVLLRNARPTFPNAGPSSTTPRTRSSATRGRSSRRRSSRRLQVRRKRGPNWSTPSHGTGSRSGRPRSPSSRRTSSVPRRRRSNHPLKGSAARVPPPSRRRPSDCAASPAPRN